MKKNKIIMWMNKEGKYYACTKSSSYKLSFGNSIDDCGQQIEPENYKDIKEAKAVANSVVKTSNLSCVIIKSTKYKSAIDGNIKGEDLEVVNAILSNREKKINQEKQLVTSV
jgi:hypothetical protein